jgi:hypothetical protein
MEKSYTEIVINACYGGFGLSQAARELYFMRKKGSVNDDDDEDLISRSDPLLVQLVKELGNEVNSEYSKLRIVKLEKGTRYRIIDIDGFESIETYNDVKWKVA